MHIAEHYRALGHSLDETPQNTPSDTTFPEYQHLPKWGTRALAITGVYAHKLSDNAAELQRQLQKISDGALPVPSTMIGAGVHGTYNAWQWQNSHAVLFKHTAPIALGHKRDFFSNRLKGLATNTFVDFMNNEGTRDKALAAYSRYLAGHLNGLNGSTQSAYDPSYCKALHLLQDHRFTYHKTKELENRCNSGLRWGPFGNAVRDVCSKALFHELLKAHGKLNALQQMNPDALIDFVERNAQAEQRAQLAHAFIKLKHLCPQGYAEYQRRVLDEQCHTQRNYAELFAQRGALYPNELLLLPTVFDIQGILIEAHNHEALTHAIELKELLFKTWQDQQQRPLRSPAYVHVISDKVGRSLIRLDWTDDIEPWIPERVLAFAKQGPDSNTQNGPECALLLNVMYRLSIESILPIAQTSGQGRYQHRREGILSNTDDLAMEGKGLLHWCIERKAPKTTFALLLAMGCQANRQWGKHGTALAYAKTHHPDAFAQLNEFDTLARNNSLTFAKAQMFQQILDKRVDVQYVMRQGYAEEGLAAFVPELMAHRVMVGKRSHPALQQTGFFAYHNGVRDMHLWLGTFQTKTHRGVHFHLGSAGLHHAIILKCNLGSVKGKLGNWVLSIPIVANNGYAELRFKFFPYRKNNQHTVCDIECGFADALTEDGTMNNPHIELLSSVICKSSLENTHQAVDDMVAMCAEYSSNQDLPMGLPTALFKSCQQLFGHAPWPILMFRMGLAMNDALLNAQGETSFFAANTYAELNALRHTWTTLKQHEYTQLKQDAAAAKADLQTYLSRIDPGRSCAIHSALKNNLPKFAAAMPANLHHIFNQTLKQTFAEWM